MSSGGRRGIDVSGVTSMRIQNASDFETQREVQLVYQTFASSTGANAYQNETPNSTGYYLKFLEGAKERASCSNCVGLPYQQALTMSFRT
jgi:hypothetical protein